MKKIETIMDLSQNIGKKGTNELILGSAGTGKTLAGGTGRLLNLLENDLPFIYISRNSDLESIRKIIGNKGYEVNFLSIDELTDEHLLDNKSYLVGVNMWLTSETIEANKLFAKLSNTKTSSKKHVIVEGEALYNADKELLLSIDALLASEIGLTLISQNVYWLEKHEDLDSYLDKFDDINIFEPNHYFDYFSVMKKYKESNVSRTESEYLFDPKEMEDFRNTIRVSNLRK